MRFMLALSVLSLACVVEAQTGSKSAKADDSDLKSTEQQWVAAYYGGDGKTLYHMEADDFTVIANGQKPQTKAEQIAEVEGRGPVGVPQPSVEEEVRHYGDVALHHWLEWRLECAFHSRLGKDERLLESRTSTLLTGVIASHTRAIPRSGSTAAEPLREQMSP